MLRAGAPAGRRRWIKTVAATTTTLAVVVFGLLTAADSQAARARGAAKLCKGTPVFGGELQGTTKNQTGHAIKRVHVEHGPGTGFFEPEPAAEVRAEHHNQWCVGSRFGVPAMKVTYQLHDGAQVEFGAYFKAVIGGMESFCGVSRPTNSHDIWGCATSTENIDCIILPGQGGGCSGGDVVFRVYRR
jgi:hypothetical protein